MSEPQDFADLPGAALVAGGTGGLGSAIARLLVRRGADVVVTYRSNKDRAAELVDELLLRADSLDLTDAAATSAYVDSLGDLHTVVYAAGPHVPQQHLSRISAADLSRQLDEDVSSFFHLAIASLPALRRTHGSMERPVHILVRLDEERHVRHAVRIDRLQDLLVDQVVGLYKYFCRVECVIVKCSRNTCCIQGTGIFCFQ